MKNRDWSTLVGRSHALVAAVDPELVYVAAQGALYAASPERGVFKFALLDKYAPNTVRNFVALAEAFLEQQSQMYQEAPKQLSADAMATLAVANLFGLASIQGTAQALGMANTQTSSDFGCSVGADTTTLRDLARFGEMMRLDGRFNGQQIVPKAVVDDIRRGADKTHFAKAGYALLPGWSYRNMWWVSHNEHGAYMARGVHGPANVLLLEIESEHVTEVFSGFGEMAEDLGRAPSSASVGARMIEGMPILWRAFLEACPFDEKFIGWGGDKISLIDVLRGLAREGVLDMRVLTSVAALHQPHATDPTHTSELSRENERRRAAGS